MHDDDFDLFILGAGSGGVRAARLTAELGLKVGICEEEEKEEVNCKSQV